MKPKTVNDLIPNTVYYIILSPTGRPTKVTYLGCVKESYGCNFYFKFIERKGYKGSIAFFDINEVGIATTPEEVKSSYGKIKHELPEIHLNSRREIPGLENQPNPEWSNYTLFKKSPFVEQSGPLILQCEHNYAEMKNALEYSFNQFKGYSSQYKNSREKILSNIETIGWINNNINWVISP